jgi:hypothetical protein
VGSAWNASLIVVVTAGASPAVACLGIKSI